MLTGEKDQTIYRKHYEIIQSNEAKKAYNYLIGWATTLKIHECFPSRKDFRFMRGNDWDFAFIPNRKWLLFYFRKPCLNSGKFSKTKIIENFPDTKENNSGELTIRVKTLEMATQLAAYIET